MVFEDDNSEQDTSASENDDILQEELESHITSPIEDTWIEISDYCIK